MSETEEVIPYADAIKPRAGLWLGTILAVYAIANVGLQFANDMDLQQLARLTGNATPTAAMVFLERLYLASAACTLIGTGLLLLKRPLGGMVIAGIHIVHLVVIVPLLLAILYTSERVRTTAPAALAESAAGSVLSWIAGGAWVWLICRMAAEMRRQKAGEANWPAIHRACAWSLLLFGIARGLMVLIPTVRMARNSQVLWWPSAVPVGIAAGLLTLGGAGAVLRKRWAWRICIAGATAWGMHAWFTNVARWIVSADLAKLVRGIELSSLLHSLDQLPMALLWILVLCHPAIRAQWSVVAVAERPMQA